MPKRCILGRQVLLPLRGQDLSLIEAIYHNSQAKRIEGHCWVRERASSGEGAQGETARGPLGAESRSSPLSSIWLCVALCWQVFEVHEPISLGKPAHYSFLFTSSIESIEDALPVTSNLVAKAGSEFWWQIIKLQVILPKRFI